MNSVLSELIRKKKSCCAPANLSHSHRRRFKYSLVLVRHSKEVVTKDDLMKEVWPDAFVEEANLSRNIFMLRKVLGESSKDHQYILTVPGRGYRFAESVRLVPEQEVGIIAAQHSKVQMEVKESKRWVRIAAGIIVVAIGAALVSLLKRPPAVPIVEAVTQLTDDWEPKPYGTKIVNDGVRVYFNEGTRGSLKIAQVAVTGGSVAVIPTTVANPIIVRRSGP
jgi:DNA-binding winged helix-turn-helix (wHTH) protein